MARVAPIQDPRLNSLADDLAAVQGSLAIVAEALRSSPEVVAAQAIHELTSANATLTRLLEILVADETPRPETPHATRSSLENDLVATIRDGILADPSLRRTYYSSLDRMSSLAADFVIELFRRGGDDPVKTFSAYDLRCAMKHITGQERGHLGVNSILKSVGLMKLVVPGRMSMGYRLTADARALHARARNA